MFYCNKCRKRVVVIVTVPIIEKGEIIDTSEGIQVDSDGIVTDFWSDGIRGIPDELRELAAEEVEGICVNCHGLVEWENK